MSGAVPTATRFLVEWYRPDLTPQSTDDLVADLDRATADLSAEGSPVWVLMTLAVPTDEVLYGVFAAHSPDVVQAACIRAGAAPERMSYDVDARITEHFRVGSSGPPPQLAV
ncbi:hypothetical protein MMAD_09350 [Mycolicibacterium madagascariense]|uniref:DUF4242 domain-containing protein n=1 Tax=Mycolicibacterium madagascariense TaxID=212765 RepID=A0A7I7XBE9_9MYCO|nr:hypothetical protein [Mycolicibacterium madagascariense]MCV7014930.1 hypothetical protein [Mycolicibacterium madagascariense]BBZ26640.1 hypothetical protein MMAD_09350 [Mycolicibacterium madagascariense]